MNRYSRAIRKHVSGVGSFVSIPQAISAANEGLKDGFKMETNSLFSEKNILGEQVFTTDWFLLDVGAADMDAIDLNKVSKDCDIVKDIVARHPDKVRKMLASFKQGNTAEELMKGFDIVRELGLREEDVVAKGGGLLGVLLVVGAAVLLSGCQACGHGHAGKRPTNPPEN
jgi:hypothetical protein